MYIFISSPPLHNYYPKKTRHATFNFDKCKNSYDNGSGGDEYNMKTVKKFSFVPKEMFEKENIEGIVTHDVEIPIHVEEPTPDWSLMPWNELRDVVEVLMHGAEKHGRFDWQRAVMDDLDRYQNHAMEHWVKYNTEGRTEKESGKSHLAHMVADILFLMWRDNQR
jgi:hypothetical protein